MLLIKNYQQIAHWKLMPPNRKVSMESYMSGIWKRKIAIWSTSNKIQSYPSIMCLSVCVRLVVFVCVFRIAVAFRFAQANMNILTRNVPPRGGTYAPSSRTNIWVYIEILISKCRQSHQIHIKHMWEYARGFYFKFTVTFIIMMSHLYVNKPHMSIVHTHRQNRTRAIRGVYNWKWTEMMNE